jgi:endogenous inhibitor of DNA gyrase (YacG/DUF329 family)
MTEVCPICGEPVDKDEGDPHGHFDTTNVPCTICGKLPDDHPLVLPDDHPLAGKVESADHEYESGI